MTICRSSARRTRMVQHSVSGIQVEFCRCLRLLGGATSVVMTVLHRKNDLYRCLLTEGLLDSKPLSNEHISKSADRSSGNTPATNGATQPGISIRYGPADDNDLEMRDADVNGSSQSKRKSRSSAGKISYAEPESSEEDDKPLVRRIPYLYSANPPPISQFTTID